uniref:Uncharacterized protein n=1 Tax=Aegilops tauschii subsp. strangulata TaxID=200361 RepID=A0A453CFY4_AEGTS
LQLVITSETSFLVELMQSYNFALLKFSPANLIMCSRNSCLVTRIAKDFPNFNCTVPFL